MHVRIECDLNNSTDFSILGDWIGSQLKSQWDMPYGPMPVISGLPSELSFEMRKALTAAAANFGCPMLWVEGTTRIPNEVNYQGELSFTSLDLEESYQRLGPKGTVDLVVIGCPQASIGEIRSVVAEVRGRMELGWSCSARRARPRRQPRLLPPGLIHARASWPQRRGRRFRSCLS